MSRWIPWWQNLKNEEMILDIPFSETEVMDTILRLKEGTSTGPDSLQVEHLKFGGNAVSSVAERGVECHN